MARIIFSAIMKPESMWPVEWKSLKFHSTQQKCKQIQGPSTDFHSRGRSADAWVQGCQAAWFDFKAGKDDHQQLCLLIQVQVQVRLLVLVSDDSRAQSSAEQSAVLLTRIRVSTGLPSSLAAGGDLQTQPAASPTPTHSSTQPLWHYATMPLWPWIHTVIILDWSKWILVHKTHTSTMALWHCDAMPL